MKCCILRPCNGRFFLRWQFHFFNWSRARRRRGGRIHLSAGKSARVTMDIPAERFRFWDVDKKQYVVEPGDYEFLIGAASDDIRLRVPFKIAAR
ncbi:MAG: fibronectin type III-like domain-contianing protein [Limisphaerales bacterium]